jgi:hypothetical protein
MRTEAPHSEFPNPGTSAKLGMGKLDIRRPLSDNQWEGWIWAVNVTGIIINTEGNSADRKSQEQNTRDVHIGTTLEGE